MALTVKTNIIELSDTVQFEIKQHEQSLQQACHAAALALGSVGTVLLGFINGGLAEIFVGNEMERSIADISTEIIKDKIESRGRFYLSEKPRLGELLLQLANTLSVEEPGEQIEETAAEQMAKIHAVRVLHLLAMGDSASSDRTLENFLVEATVSPLLNGVFLMASTSGHCLVAAKEGMQTKVNYSGTGRIPLAPLGEYVTSENRKHKACWNVVATVFGAIEMQLANLQNVYKSIEVESESKNDIQISDPEDLRGRLTCLEGFITNMKEAIDFCQKKIIACEAVLEGTYLSTGTEFAESLKNVYQTLNNVFIHILEAVIATQERCADLLDELEFFHAIQSADNPQMQQLRFYSHIILKSLSERTEQQICSSEDKSAVPSLDSKISENVEQLKRCLEGMFEIPIASANLDIENPLKIIEKDKQQAEAAGDNASIDHLGGSRIVLLCKLINLDYKIVSLGQKRSRVFASERKDCDAQLETLGCELQLSLSCFGVSSSGKQGGRRASYSGATSTKAGMFPPRKRRKSVCLPSGAGFKFKPEDGALNSLDNIQELYSDTAGSSSSSSSRSTSSSSANSRPQLP